MAMAMAVFVRDRLGEIRRAVVPGPVRDRWARKLVATRPCLWAELLMTLVKVVRLGL